jgi:hypothetical protein
MGYFCECNRYKRNSTDGKGLFLLKRKTYRNHLIKQKNLLDANNEITSEDSENSDDILEDEYEESNYRYIYEHNFVIVLYIFLLF